MNYVPLSFLSLSVHRSQDNDLPASPLGLLTSSKRILGSLQLHRQGDRQAITVRNSLSELLEARGWSVGHFGPRPRVFSCRIEGKGKVGGRRTRKGSSSFPCPSPGLSLQKQA